MRIQVIIFSLMLSLFSLVAMAGAGHDHGHSNDPVTQSQAEEIAANSISALVGNGRIDESWKSINATRSEKKKFGANMEWVVVFNNNNITDPAKQTLYVFLNLGGKYLATNYTGD